MSTPPSADLIEHLSFGFMASKVLFSAIEVGLFTELAKGPLDAGEIQKLCGLHPRGIRDFLDTLVALGMLEHRGEIYSNSLETDFYLDRAKPTYIGNYVEINSLRENGSSISSQKRCGPASRKTKSRVGMRIGLTLFMRPPKDFASFYGA
jgi:hypothetical protein